MPCYSPLKGWLSKETGGIIFKQDGHAGGKMEVACGQCLGCRLDHSRMWAMRIVHEAESWDENCFITLTYREKADCTKKQLKEGKYLPSDGSLDKSHFQKFMKRLRKHFSKREIRYYHCGEYGEKLDRPHYHACLFNVEFSDKELFQERDGNFLFISETLEKIWGYGFCTIGELTFESAAYTARYILKKITGNQSHEHYLRCDEDGVAYWLQSEYTTMSRRPGIGKDFYDKFKTDIFPSDEVPVPGSGVFKKVPRYYDEMLRKEAEGEFEEVKRLRKVFKDEHGEDFTPERLMDRYKVQMAKASFLKREMI